MVVPPVSGIVVPSKVPPKQIEEPLIVRPIVLSQLAQRRLIWLELRRQRRGFVKVRYSFETCAAAAASLGPRGVGSSMRHWAGDIELVTLCCYLAQCRPRVSGDVVQW